MLGITLGMVPMALMNGFVAFLLWLYVTLMVPHAYLYGLMADFRYTFVYAAIALGALVLGRVKERGRFILDKTFILLLIFMAHALLSALVSLEPNPHVPMRQELFIKGMALSLAAPFFLTSRWRIHMTLVVIVAGLGFHGIDDGLKMISSGGAHIVYGIPRSTLNDNNLYALGMVMLMPLALYLAKYSAYKVAKWVSLGVFALCILTVLGSNSRGGFLALAVLGVWYWITSSRKFVSLIFIGIVAFGIVEFAPDRWFDRIETLKNAGEDGSFLGRVAAWKVSVNIANDNPVFGAGFNAVQMQWIWNQYKDIPNFIQITIPEMYSKAAHSNYFQVLGDLGYVGLLLFLALLASAFITRWQIKAEATKSKGKHEWAVDLATSINLSLMAFMAGGAGVSLAYFELVYLLIVLLSIILRLVREETSILNAAAPVHPMKAPLHA